MSATPIIYSSTDASAPVLDGQVGSLLTVLRAVLVTGYGSKAAAGWSEPFAAAGNIGVFRNNSAVGTGAYYRFDDSASSAGVGKTAVIRGYKSMTGLSAGTDAFPTVGQEAAGLYIRKSSAASATARPWWIVACRRWAYLFIDSNSVGIEGAQPYFLGDLESMRPSDAYHCAVMAGRIADPATNGACSLWTNNLVGASSTPVGATGGAYLAGPFSQIPSSTAVQLLQPYGLASVLGGSSGWSYPHGPNTGLLFGKVLVMEGPYTARGWMPGLLAPWHNRVLTDLTTLANVPSTGKTSVSKRYSQRPDNTSTFGELLFDVTTAY